MAKCYYFEIKIKINTKGGSNLLKIVPVLEKESTSKKMSSFKEILRYIWEKVTMGKGSRKEI